MERKNKFLVTTSALKKILTMLGSNKVFNITVQPGGCNGFEYNFSISDYKKNKESEKECSPIQQESMKNADQQQLIGKEFKEHYMIYLNTKPLLFIDNASLKKIEGATLDYVIELMNERFVIKNPNSKSSCSCGSSFGG